MKRKENPAVITEKVLDLIESGCIDPWIGAKLQCYAIHQDWPVQEVLNHALRNFLEDEEERKADTGWKYTFAH